jgi:hypothetical protein
MWLQRSPWLDVTALCSVRTDRILVDRGKQGRTAGYPTAPSQIPACGITAPGSSELLASARPATVAAHVAIPHSEVGTIYSGLSYPVRVSFMGYTAPSLPSPCGRPYRLRVLWSDLTPHRPSGVLRFVGTPYPFEGEDGVSQVPDISLPACHAL